MRAGVAVVLLVVLPIVAGLDVWAALRSCDNTSIRDYVFRQHEIQCVGEASACETVLNSTTTAHSCSFQHGRHSCSFLTSPRPSSIVSTQWRDMTCVCAGDVECRVRVIARLSTALGDILGTAFVALVLIVLYVRVELFRDFMDVVLTVITAVVLWTFSMKCVDALSAFCSSINRDDDD
jgi:hypothetical protein